MVSAAAAGVHVEATQGRLSALPWLQQIPSLRAPTWFEQPSIVSQLVRQTKVSVHLTRELTPLVNEIMR